MNYAAHPMIPPKVVAIATDKTIQPMQSFGDPANLPLVADPRYGQDITFGYNMPAPRKQSVGNTPEELKPKMRRLVSIFAAGDKTGMAQRLIDAFLEKQRKVTYFDDADLNAAAARHQNIEAFCDAALSPPPPPVRWGRGGGPKSMPKRRIHQALREAGWDIRKIVVPADLGVPAFNLGDRGLATEDFDNGLGLMINGVQHAFAIATHYHYDEKQETYWLWLKFIFYDVFGLDDLDLERFGASADSRLHTPQGVGITAWWQLQHQHGYAPLVTRVVVRKTYEIKAT
jgi:hypothetical protein